jgi:hypothetical protein
MRQSQNALTRKAPRPILSTDERHFPITAGGSYSISEGTVEKSSSGFVAGVSAGVRGFLHHGGHYVGYLLA